MGRTGAADATRLGCSSPRAGHERRPCRPAAGSADRHGALAGIIYRSHRFKDAHRDGVILRGLDQRANVFGEAGATIAGPGIQEFLADPIIEADAARHFLHVGADLFTKISNLVDEADLGRQEVVAGVFHHLGAEHIHDENRVAVADEGVVEIAHRLADQVQRRHGQEDHRPRKDE